MIDIYKYLQIPSLPLPHKLGLYSMHSVWNANHFSQTRLISMLGLWQRVETKKWRNASKNQNMALQISASSLWSICLLHPVARLFVVWLKLKNRHHHQQFVRVKPRQFQSRPDLCNYRTKLAQCQDILQKPNLQTNPKTAKIFTFKN